MKEDVPMKKQVYQAALVIGTIILIPFQVCAAEYTLRLSHFFPASAGTNKEIFKPWAKAVEKDSGGRIKVDIYPSSTLAKPTAQYDAAALYRIADISVAIQGYTANRFPLTQIVELPGVSKDAVNGSCILQSLYDEGLIAGEYAKAKPLFLFTHGPGHIHTTSKLVKVPKDLEGLRIRRPTTVVGNMLKSMGAQPIGLPATSAYQSVQRGIIDGVTLPWEAQISFRLNEVTPKHTEVGGLYTLSFVTVMNKDVYNSLPKDLQQVIDKNSGKHWSRIAGQVFDQLDITGRQQALDMGHEVYTVPDGGNNPAWKPYLDKTRESYLDELEQKNLPARKVYQRAMELSQSCPM
jgi:TRAP-type C4-dicarboxylate transport system substrate-binding protein